MKTIETILATYDGNRTSTDIEMRQWLNAHRKEYDAFRMKMMTGDWEMLGKMHKLLQQCLPSEAKAYFNRLSLWITDKMELAELIVKEPGLEDEADALYEQQAWKNASTEIQTMVADCISESEEPMTDEEKQECYEIITTAFIALQQHSFRFVKGFLESMRTKAKGKEGSVLRMMYCFAVFDGGIGHMMGVLSGHLGNPLADSQSRAMARSWIPNIVQQSVFMGIENKETWGGRAEHSCPDMWKEIMFSLRDVSTTMRHKATTKSIEDLCPDSVKPKIKEFLKKNEDLICLAYLLKALVLSGKIDAGTKYLTFHRAIEQATGKKLKHAQPQRRYGEIKDLDLQQPQYSNSMKRAKVIIDHWVPVFAAC